MTPNVHYSLVSLARPKRAKEQLLSLEAEEVAKTSIPDSVISNCEPTETLNFSTMTAETPFISLETVNLTQPKASSLPEVIHPGMPASIGTTSMMQGMMFPFTNPLFFQPRVPINTKTNKPMNYRTVPCRNFHSPAGCERGDNCHFIHDFGFEGRPIANLNDWKRSNEIRQKNLKAMQDLNVGFAAYYPPAGPEPHLMGRRSA